MTDELERQLRRRLAQEEVQLDDDGFVDEVARRISTTRQRAGWLALERALNLVVLPAMMVFALWILVPALIVALAPAMTAVGVPAAGAALPLAIAAGTTMYTWLRS
ncbi:MAG: hypothetical protein IT184_17775 [Acidobacteria bacterium]|nr:hypothetical protein [Acidobacteriota bacterium]